jgi:regulatory protein YycI of two-component signal transduction system YycFG
MSITEQHLKRIQDKLQQFLKLHAALQKENVQLKEELIKSKEGAKLQQQHIDTLKQKVDILKLNAGEMSEADKKEFEKKINTYLKEIDRCIALLGG